MVASNIRKREREWKTNEIMNAAQNHFFKNGFNKTTMDEIAAEMELTKPALYRYFKNKEDLYFAVVVRGTEILNKMMEDAVSSENTGLDKILATGHTYCNFYYQYPDHCRLMLEARNIYPKCLESSYLQKITQNGQNYLGIMCEAIETGKKDGSINSDIETFLTAAYLVESLISVLRSSEILDDVLMSKGMTKRDFIENSLELMRQALQNKGYENL